MRCIALQQHAAHTTRPHMCDAKRRKVLQCVTMCWRVLQCVAVCCSALQCVAVRCSALQWQTSMLQCGALARHTHDANGYVWRDSFVCVCDTQRHFVCIEPLTCALSRGRRQRKRGGGQRGGRKRRKRYRFSKVKSLLNLLNRSAVCCSVLQCVALLVCCSVLQCVATLQESNRYIHIYVYIHTYIYICKSQVAPKFIT